MQQLAGRQGGENGMQVLSGVQLHQVVTHRTPGTDTQQVLELPGYVPAINHHNYVSNVWVGKGLIR